MASHRIIELDKTILPAMAGSVKAMHIDRDALLMWRHLIAETR